MSTVFVLVWKAVLRTTHEPVEIGAGKVPAGFAIGNRPSPANARPKYDYAEFNPLFVRPQF